MEGRPVIVEKDAVGHCMAVLISYQSSNNRKSLPGERELFLFYLILILLRIILLFFIIFSGIHLIRPMCRAYVVMK